MKLFPTGSPHSDVAEVWRIEDPPLPIPRIEMRCAVCGSAAIILRGWKFHERTRTGSKSPWRCDVTTKCTRCSHVAWFGVALTEEQWNRQPRANARSLNWREGLRLLQGAGIVDEDGNVID